MTYTFFRGLPFVLRPMRNAIPTIKPKGPYTAARSFTENTKHIDNLQDGTDFYQFRGIRVHIQQLFLRTFSVLLSRFFYI